MLEKSFGLLFYLKPAKNQKGNVRYMFIYGLQSREKLQSYPQKSYGIPNTGIR